MNVTCSLSITFTFVTQLGTLGEARGKLTLLARFDFNLLPSTMSNRIGLHLSPSLWLDNGYNFTLPYNTSENQLAYIEDFYDLTSAAPGAHAKIQGKFLSLFLWCGQTESKETNRLSQLLPAKYEATTSHLETATTSHLDQLFISFASGEQDNDLPPETPMVIISTIDIFK